MLSGDVEWQKGMNATEKRIKMIMTMSTRIMSIRIVSSIVSLIVILIVPIIRF